MKSFVFFHIISVSILQKSVAAAFFVPCGCPVFTTRLSVTHSKNTDNQDVQNIFYQNQAWKARKLVEDPDFFLQYEAKYSPEFMWIGECEQRVLTSTVALV
jgi:hypothetical protein